MFYSREWFCACFRSINQIDLGNQEVLMIEGEMNFQLQYNLLVSVKWKNGVSKQKASLTIISVLPVYFILPQTNHWTLWIIAVISLAGGFCVSWPFTWWVEKGFTYVCTVCQVWGWKRKKKKKPLPLYQMPLLWCHCYDRPLEYGKSKCFVTHTDTVETLIMFIVPRLFQRVVSGWKATQKKYTSSRPGQNVSICESTPWPWVAEYVTHLKHCGTCTIIVVTTIVRFSTEDESLLYGWSIIFTKRSNSFQYPICKRENIFVIIKMTAILSTLMLSSAQGPFPLSFKIIL